VALLIVSFLAGALTVLAPCILPLLPIIIGGSLAGDHKVAWKRTITIIVSLSISVIIFSLLLRASTVLLGVPQEFWQVVSGGIVLLLGINFLFPIIWTTISARLKLQQSTDIALGKASSKDGTFGAILTGAALGPVFSSCSPTYALILAAILPVSFGLGLLYLSAYVLGMSLMLLLVAYFGRQLTQRLGWSADEDGWFRRTLGILFIIVGLGVIFGWDKSLQAWLLDLGVYDGTTGLEQFIEL
jgi:cytochrome c-type biogenesis protein